MPIYQYRDENGHLVATDTLPSLSSEQELQSRAAKLNGTTSRINALGHFPLTPAQREEQRKRAKQTSELRKIRDKNDEEKKLLMEKERLEQAQADLEREGYMEAVIEGGFGEKVAKSISEGNYDDAAEEIVKDYVEAKAAEKVIILAAGGWAKAWQILKGVWRASKVRKLKKALQSKIAKRLEEIAEKLGGRKAAGSAGAVVVKAKSTYKPPLNNRHSIRHVKQGGVKKAKNTVSEPRIDMKRDVERINNGEGVRDGNLFTVDGRTYELIDDHLVPHSGDGFHALSRGEFDALGVFNKLGDTPQSRAIAEKVAGSDGAKKAYEVWKLGEK